LVKDKFIFDRTDRVKKNPVDLYKKDPEKNYQCTNPGKANHWPLPAGSTSRHALLFWRNVSSAGIMKKGCKGGYLYPRIKLFLNPVNPVHPVKK
jgi:hypothetical protein